MNPKDNQRTKPTEVNELNQPIKGVSLSLDAWRRLSKNKMAIFGLVVVIIYTLLAIFAPVLPIHSYKKIILEHSHLPPSLTKTAGQLWYEKEEAYMKKVAAKEGRKELNAAQLAKLQEIKQKIETETALINGKQVKIHQRHYLLGTDYHGRDMLARIIYGGQISIAIGFIGTFTSILIGIIVGALAGYLGGRVDYILMRIVDVMFGLPYLLLVIIIMAMVQGTGAGAEAKILAIFLALSIVSWLIPARMVRGQIITLKNSEYVEAAQSIGASTARIIFRHMLPNTLGIIIIYSTLRVPTFIMMESFLSFLGLGISAPYASWGSLVKDAVESMDLYPWRLFFPAIAMTLFLFAMNFLGDGLRDAFDPQSKNRL